MQSSSNHLRRWGHATLILALPFISSVVLGAEKTPSAVTEARRVSIVDQGAVSDSATINTVAIQRTIDRLASAGGGTVVIPRGEFVSGALYLKPGVHVHLEKDAVLRCSTDMVNFPPRRTRIEGHFEDSFNTALINADHCDGLRITGEGTLDGAGRPIWDEFWKQKNAAAGHKNFKNLSIARARLVIIENSRDVAVEGLTFKDSQYWNLHFYRCRDVVVKNSRFTVPTDYKQAPSTDGIDVDSCQDVVIDGCYFSVTDDCIAMKGSKGPFAMNDRDSLPVERVRIRNCVFKRGYGALTLGSEATVVRDIVFENSRVIGNMHVLHLKLRPDTPQLYEDIHVRGIVLDHTSGDILYAKPWTQYFDLEGQPPPKSTVRNITVSNISGRIGGLGELNGNPGQTTISDILMKDIQVNVRKTGFITRNVSNLRFENVLVNGASFPPPTAK